MRIALAAGLLGLVVNAATLAHPVEGYGTRAHYLANEAILVTSGETKILFDPLFTHSYGYPLVAPDTKARLMAGEGEFAGVDAVFVSHVHGDHFDAPEMNAYLATHPDVVLVAPHQAQLDMRAASGWQERFAERLQIMPFVSRPQELVIAADGEAEAIRIETVHIPHAGGPGRSHIQNMVFRVTLNGEATVMHLGDATQDPRAYAGHETHFQARETHNAFPPYWLISTWGGDVVRERLNADHITGIHVPINAPVAVPASREDFFTEAGEIRAIHGHD